MAEIESEGEQGCIESILKRVNHIGVGETEWSTTEDFHPQPTNVYFNRRIKVVKENTSLLISLDSIEIIDNFRTRRFKIVAQFTSNTLTSIKSAVSSSDNEIQEADLHEAPPINRWLALNILNYNLNPPPNPSLN